MDFPENEPRGYVGSGSFPDLMNDPAYATNVNADGKEKGFEEPDTCRICRGEGSEDDQLFYPCRCSGSIKFVHQSCLVEWLSHSQKKYCELCKTPFRFTKLYDPKMPQDLPAPLFFKQLSLHILQTVVTWLRFVLVAFVWLGWLPWSMRAIWRALFWLADGRWPGGNTLQQNTTQAGLVADHTSLTEAVVAATSSAVSTAVQSTVTDAPPVESPASSMFSYSTGEPLMLAFIKKGLSTLFLPAISSNTAPGNANLTTGSPKLRQPSWLSDVKFLNSLTRSPTINNIIIDTLEGQLITLLVVLAFILVFLIREWVVQQQPMANIADGEREAAVQLIANNPLNQEGPQPELQPQPNLHQDEFHNDDAEDPAEHISDHGEEELLPAQEDAFRENPFNFQNMTAEGLNTSADFMRPSSADHGTGYHQPTERASAHNQLWPTFRDLWMRGDGNPDHILRIIEQEGREEELDWLVILMTRLQQKRSSNGDPANTDAGATMESVMNNIETDRDGLPAFAESAHATSTIHPQPEPLADIGPTRDIAPPHFGVESGAGSSGHAFTFDFQRQSDVSTNPENEPVAESSATAGSNDGTFAGQEHSAANTPAPNNMDSVGARQSETHHEPPNTAESPARIPRPLAERVLDWFWADITPEVPAQERPQQDDEHIVEDPALEEPFIPVQNNQRFADDIDQDVVDAAGEPVDANDVEAIDEADDLEGILELIGMQGPIFGLLQNGVFSALLISFTVALGIWLPYLWGKIALVLLANPIELLFGVPMTAVSVVADVTLDTLIGSLGYVMYAISIICKVVLSPFGSIVPLGDWVPRTKTVTSASLSLIDASGSRLRKVVNAFFVFHESDVPMFSVLSHQALKIHEARIVGLFRALFVVCKFILHDLPLRLITLDLRGLSWIDFKAMDISNIIAQTRGQLHNFVRHPFLSLGSTKWVNAGLTKTATFGQPGDYYSLAVWGSGDRVIAIIMGYVLASVLSLLYLRITGFLSGVNRGQRMEGLVADVLHQAGGVMKVILIIGIEMIVFPLYCGSLLDLALMPLFENATIASRIEFTNKTPLTSLFVHWFIGTCYMFHFALFVSMCRKIMRSGVLYFIRDPDDPTFHPVRDVLERNITTQLRKIAFSAMVYGALVIVCLGGVVWGLYYAFDEIFPVHWAATIPVLEFPADLLFYNVIMPFALREIKPGDGLNDLYGWWFHKCARLLRLTNFFFGERQPDEEGHHVRRTWWDVLSGKKGDITHPVVSEEQRKCVEKDGLNAYFVRNGRFVRAPASDQVRIPKGSRVFLDVTEDNKRLDGAPDTDTGLHGWNSESFTKVYVPPFFKIRIAAFIFSLWVFAAITGVGITVLPLVTGRKILSSYFPKHAPLNDIYAFSAGICVVGSAAYAVMHCRTAFAAVRNFLHPYLRSPRQACLGFYNATISGLRVAYIVTAFSVVLPSLAALILELYVMIPLHTYFGGTQAPVIHFVQDWTLGVLYVQMVIKITLWNRRSRPAIALKNIFPEDRWFNPNVRLATRALFLPIVLAGAIAVVIPLVFGFALNSTVFASSLGVQTKVYRYAYPNALLLGVMVWLVIWVRRQIETWRTNVRDDVYLIGERLHNFRDKKGQNSVASR